MSETCKKQPVAFNLHIHLAQYLPRVQWNCVEAVHPSWFIFWNPEPGAVICCANERYEVTPDRAFLIPPYTVISGFSEKKFPHFYAHFTAGEPFEHATNQIYVMPSEPAKRLFEKFFTLDAMHRQLGWHIMILEYLAMLPDAALNGENQQIDSRIKRALKMINQNPHGSLSNHALAKMCSMSENNFYRCFRKQMNISPQRYIKSLQLNAARNMLINSNIAIEEIATQCGFADRYSFSKAFKSFFAVSPGSLRLNSKKNLPES